MRYVQVKPEQIPAGRSALLLFIHDDALCGGLIEHRPDGRLRREVPDHPVPTDVVPMIGKLLAHQSGELVYIVIEDAAYWPDAFPQLAN